MDQGSMNPVAMHNLGSNHLGSGAPGSNIPTTTVSTPSEDLRKIQTNFAKIESDWAEIESKEEQISALQKQVQWDISHTTHTFNACNSDSAWTVHSKNWTVVDQLNNDDAEIKQINGKVSGIVNVMDKLDPSLTIKNLLSALEQVNLGFSLNKSSDYTYIETNMPTDTSTDTTQVESALEAICSMITQQIQIDKDTAEGSVVGNPNASEDSLQAIQLQGKLADNFSAFETSLTTLQTDTNNNINSENYDEAHHSKAAMVLGTDTSEIAEEKKQTAKDNIVLNTITYVEATLANFSADLQNRQFANITQAITQIVAQMKAILANPKLSAAEKTAKLAVCTQILLGFLQLILQVAENVRSKNQQQMDKANLQAQTLNMHTITTDAEDIAHMKEIKKFLSVLKDVMTVINIAVITLCFATGNIGAGIALSALEIMNQTGATKDLTNDLAKGEHSQEGANITMAGLTMAVTMVGGAAIDAVIKRIAAQVAIAARAAEGAVSEEIDLLIKQAVEQATPSSLGSSSDDAMTSITRPSEISREQAAAEDAEGIEMTDIPAGTTAPTFAEQVAKESAESATKTVDKEFKTLIQESEKVAEKAAKSVKFSEGDYKNLVQKTQDLAAKNAVEQFYKETSCLSFGRIRDLFRAGIGGSPSKALTEYVGEAMRAAAKDAVQTASKLSEEDFAVKTVDEQITAISKESSSCANSTLRQATDYAAKQAAKEAETSESTGTLDSLKKQMAKTSQSLPMRAVKSKAFSAGMLMWTQNQNSSSIAGNNQGLQIATSLFSGIGQGMAMSKLTGIMDILAAGKASRAVTVLLTAGAVMTAASQASNAISDYSQGKMEIQEASSEKSIAIAEALNSLLSNLSSRSQDLAPSNSPFQAEEKELREQQLWLSSHQWDGINEGCKVLAAQSV